MSPSQLDSIPFSSMSDDKLSAFLRENQIGLTVSEAREIEKMLGRGPTLTESIMIGIQGSEHCSYRSSRDYLKKLPTKAPNILVGVGEDSGIIEIAKDSKGDKYGIIIAHESHNHPSQVVPYEGAATGVGGIMRDIVCMGGRAIASLDPLRFGDLKSNNTKQIASEVVSGIAGYGNPLGVANIGGDIYFDESYNENCLVNVVGIGVLKEDEIIHSYAPKNADGYDIIVVGKPTDNSGMGGAAFASIDLDEEDKDANKGAVQEPNPFLEQHILEATYELFEILKKKKLLQKVACKDMGAGGIMCASIEIAEGGGYGASLDLEKVHVATQNLHPSVIACSETQERFCWICPPDITQMILDHYNKTWDFPKVSHKAAASAIGKLNTSGNYKLVYKGKTICDAPTHILTKGLKYTRESKKPKKHIHSISLPEKIDYNEMTLKILSHKDVCSRREVYNRYDKHVQGLTVLETGLADSGVLAPLLNREDVEESIKNTGIALSVDSNPRYGKIDPKIAAQHAVLEAVRNVATVGATPECLTDCLNFGNPEKKESFWEFSESIEGLVEAATKLCLKDYPLNPIPYISGNVSFYNESKHSAVAPSPIICCLGTLKDAHTAITMQIKKSDSVLLLTGKRQKKMDGSVLADILGGQRISEYEGLPDPNLEEAKKELFAVIDCIQKGLVLSSHDISDGGLIVVVAEMILGGWAEGNIGVKMNTDYEIYTLFGESGGVVLETKKEHIKEIKKIFQKYGVIVTEIGHTIHEQKLILDPVINLDIVDMKKAWSTSLRTLMK